MPFKKKIPILATTNKSSHLAKKIVVVDGMIGGGKNLLSTIISGLPNVEMFLLKYEIENICALNHLGHLSLDAAKSLINIWTDEEIYNQSMSRNTNFKPSDNSSVFKNARPLRYFKRLFKSPSEAEKSLKKEKPILNLMTHVNTNYSNPLFEALNERLVYIRVVRHPMTTFMIKHNKKWVKRWAINDRHGPILCKASDRKLKSIHIPFYAKDIEKAYIKANFTDKTILLFDQWIRKSDNFIDEKVKSTNATIFEIPFEKFVFEPQIYIKKIATALGVIPDKVTSKIMKLQDVPRNSLNEFQKRYFFSKNIQSKTNRVFNLKESFAEARSYVAKTASKRALFNLDKLAADYEKRHKII